MFGAILHIYSVFVFAICVLIFLITIVNIIWLEHTLTLDRKKTGPSVAILIYAHNDATHIGACLESILKQDYSTYQIYAIDDHSSDDTWKILRDYMLRYPRKLKAFKAETLPEGWQGKPYAFQELSRHTKEDYLICTTADTIHRSDSIGKAIAIAEKYHADLVTGYVHRRTPSFAVASIDPALYFHSLFYLPLFLIPLTKSQALSLATSEFMCFRHDFFQEIGGYEKAKGQVSCHIKMAQAVKQCGGKIAFVDLKDTVDCPINTNYGDFTKNAAKIAFSNIGESSIILLSATIIIPLCFFVPILAWGISGSSFSQALSYLRASTIVVLYTWLLEAINRRSPWYVPFIYPLILAHSLHALWRGSRASSKTQS